MKIIGLIGGMSWESSLEYYRIINQEVRRRLGGLHSARSVMFSVDFHEIERLQKEEAWEEAGEHLAGAARALERAGAELLVLCTNTMHKVAGILEERSRVPFLHIADATGGAVAAKGIGRVGLLGTLYTMEQDFYKKRLKQRYGLEVLIPPAPMRQTVHEIIFQELCLGIVEAASREKYLEALDELAAQGAEGVILGCTEISLLIRQEQCSIPLFDTTQLHARRAVDMALEDEKGGPGR